MADQAGEKCSYPNCGCKAGSDNNYCTSIRSNGKNTRHRLQMRTSRFERPRDLNLGASRLNGIPRKDPKPHRILSLRFCSRTCTHAPLRRDNTVRCTIRSSLGLGYLRCTSPFLVLSSGSPLHELATSGPTSTGVFHGSTQCFTACTPITCSVHPQ
jgi:hypothetical protein